MKLMQRVETAHSFLQSVFNLSHVIILSLPMYFYIWLSKISLKPIFQNGEIGRFNQCLHVESF